MAIREQRDLAAGQELALKSVLQEVDALQTVFQQKIEGIKGEMAATQDAAMKLYEQLAEVLGITGDPPVGPPGG
jgi:adenylosuccinate lyase